MPDTLPGAGGTEQKALLHRADIYLVENSGRIFWKEEDGVMASFALYYLLNKYVAGILFAFAFE